MCACRACFNAASSFFFFAAVFLGRRHRWRRWRRSLLVRQRIMASCGDCGRTSKGMLGRQAFGYRWHWMTISKRFIIERLAGTHGAGRTYEAIGKLSKGDCAFGVGEIKLKNANHS